MNSWFPFKGAADDYDRFMGRYTVPLAAALTNLAQLSDDAIVVDVGCGPGGLTLELAHRVPAVNIAAIDPAPQFVAACAERVPGADVREGTAEDLPWPDDSFDAALSCLVFAFMRDPFAGAAEMARVTKPGGVVAACMWDLSGLGMEMFNIFWQATSEVTGVTRAPDRRAGTAEGQLAEYFAAAGLRDINSGALTIEADYTDFEDFWRPFTRGVGPQTDALAKLPPDQRESVREGMRRRVPDGPFSLPGRAWYAVGRV